MNPKGRVLVAAGLAVVTAFGLGALADATKYEGEIDREDGHTEVLFEVRTHRHGDPSTAASALWLGCASAHGPQRTFGPEPLGDGSYRAGLQPSLGEEARRRLRGCLQDTSVERALGSVRSMVNRPEPLDPGS